MVRFLAVSGLFSALFVGQTEGISKSHPEPTEKGYYFVSANWTDLKGGWNLLRLSITDSSHHALTGADVKVAYDMEMPMNAPNNPIEERGEGIYEEKIFLGMSGMWKFNINIIKEGRDDSLETYKNIRKDPTKNGHYLIDANWSELKRGWNTFLMLVTDQNDQPVEDAKVTVTYDMLAHPMHPPEKPVIDRGNGTYEKSIFLGMIGRWKFDFSVAKDGVEDGVSVVREVSKK
jgi:hypothetical protein